MRKKEQITKKKNQKIETTKIEDRKKSVKPIIEMIDVEKDYVMGKGKVIVRALRGINLKIYPKEFVIIIGPSGSGKSTMVNLIGCLDRPTKGKILLKGKDISKLNDSELAQLRGKVIGFVFQQFNLLNSLTALENVMLPMIFHDIPVGERKKRATELLIRLGLGDRLNHKPTELSGGQQQRVAIARALATDPEIILADEPTGNLDSKSGDEVMKILEELYAQGKTIIFVTHDPRYMHVGTRIVKLKDGQITEDIPNNSKIKI